MMNDNPNFDQIEQEDSGQRSERASDPGPMWRSMELPPGEDWSATYRPKKSRGRRALELVMEMVQTLVVAGLLFFAVNVVTARIRVESVSMLPSLEEGEFVIISKLAYQWDDPERGDIVVFRFPLDPSRRYIKRVVALPGDRVVVRDGKVEVNGITLSEPYIADDPLYAGEWELGPDELFVLGDNRNNSLDSKNWGPLPEDNIIGKAIVIYWPFERLGLIPQYVLAAGLK
jgi:signal peptidase I